MSKGRDAKKAVKRKQNERLKKNVKIKKTKQLKSSFEYLNLESTTKKSP